MNQSCRLCGSEPLEKLDIIFKKRLYYLCNCCNLIQADEDTFPSAKDEKERYEMHQNSHTDMGYLNFLQQVIDPIMPYISADLKILDYGCGPNPVLAELLNDKGFICDIYDPLFYSDFPNDTYDIIFSTECFEHFFHPIIDINKIISLLNSGGLLAIMTDTWHSIAQFKSWYYIRDLTHVSFYHEETIKYITNHFDFSIVHSDGERIFIIKKL
jgi:SAM-dependent methyltransferase